MLRKLRAFTTVSAHVKRHRKPSLKRVVAEARRAGERVKSVEVYGDHITLVLGAESQGDEALDARSVVQDRISKMMLTKQ
jgi:hypothetical protein